MVEDGERRDALAFRRSSFDIELITSFPFPLPARADRSSEALLLTSLALTFSFPPTTDLSKDTLFLIFFVVSGDS